MKEIQKAQEVVWYYFTAAREYMSGDSHSAIKAAYYLGAGSIQAQEYRRSYKEEKEISDFFLAVENECNNLYQLLINREEV